VFIEDSIEEIVDDECQSRRNEIYYGSTYEDFHLVFDDYNNQTSKNLTNPFLKETNQMRKKHVYGIVRPEILTIENELYETEVAFGFISEVPIPTFFRDLNRVIQRRNVYMQSKSS
jgi:hypothetical protein